MTGSAKSSEKSVRLFNDQGISVMDLDEIRRAGDRIRMRGRLIGEVQTDLYVGVRDFYRMLGMLLSPPILIFVLLSPFYWVRDHWQTQRQEAQRMARAKMLLFPTIVALVCLTIVFLVAMMILGIYGLAT